MPERVQKIMARAGIGSRRHNERLIVEGRVRINGRVAHLGDKADLRNDRIEVDNRPIVGQKLEYIMLNKPAGVISSLQDDLDVGRTTIRDLVDIPGHIYPVGRLDKQSEGLILMTNDGDLAHRLTHPRYEHTKVYLVEIEGNPSDETLQRWRDGVELDGKQTMPATIEVLKRHSDGSRLRITLREGRKRQIRRVAALLGHQVRRLIREQIGPIKLGQLPPGKWRRLSEGELSSLRLEIGRKKPRSHRSN